MAVRRAFGEIGRSGHEQNHDDMVPSPVSPDARGIPERIGTADILLAEETTSPAANYTSFNAEETNYSFNAV